MAHKLKLTTMKKVAIKLYTFFLREKNRGRLFCGIQNPEKRTMLALGISRSSFKRWTNPQSRQLAEDTLGNVINNERHSQTTRKEGRRQKFDSFDKEIVRREIVRMLEKNILVTLRRLRLWLKDKCDLHISKATLWRSIRHLGFTFRKTSGGKNVICEKPHLVAARSKYLREIKARREEGYDIVYLDESWVNAHHTFEKEWQSKDGTLKRNIPSSKGQRMILVNAGSKESGLLNEAGLVFQSKTTDGRDYHKEMNWIIFQNWMENKLLPLLDRPSCLVMDNASYHNVVADEDKVPVSSSKKAKVIEWLQDRNVVFPENALKPELLQLVKQIRGEKIYAIDKIIQLSGHTVLRLPPYHSHLNPIELIWAKVKNEVAEENTTFKMSQVKELTAKALSNVTREDWIACENHVQKEEQDYWKNDGLQFIQPRTLVTFYDSSDSE